MFWAVEKFRYKSASAKLSHIGGDVWTLIDLESTERQQGHAHGVMDQIVRHADSQGLTISLVVQMFGRYDEKMLDNFQLEEFYKKFGFERTSTRPVQMVRRPQGHISEEGS